MKANISHLVLVTGISGAGKSSVLRYLEDSGFYWIDNLPMSLIPSYLDHLGKQADGGTVPFVTTQVVANPTDIRVAIGIHWHERECLDSFRTCYRTLSLLAERVELLFVEANLDILVSRYRETRRRHPLATDHTIRDTIALETHYLGPIRALADLVIETSRLTVPQLKDRLEQLFVAGSFTSREGSNTADLTIFVRSFGFKYGVNTDADMVLDGRFLPNPHYDPALRPFSGCDTPIIRFLEKDGEAMDFLERLQALFEYLLPRYQRERKRYFTIDIGCTGGRHRSVFLVEQLAIRLRQQGFRVLLQHRDLERETPKIPPPIPAMGEEMGGEISGNSGCVVLR